LDLRTGYYLSFLRYNSGNYADAGNAWVRWASLPGEAGCLLFSKSWEPLESRRDRQSFAAVSLKNADDKTSAAFGLSRIFLPILHADPRNNAIVAAQGDRLDLGLEWRNGQNAPLAFMLWQHEGLKRFLPPPIRQGGFALGDRAALCLPKDAAGTPVYTFEIPSHFPTGDYMLLYWGATDAARGDTTDRPLLMPLRLRILPALREKGSTSGTTTLPFSALYPQYLDASPDLWSKGWFYKDIYTEGYTVKTDRSFVFSTPGRPAGRYRLTLRGSSLPNTLADSPHLAWVSVEATVVGRSRKPVGKIALKSLRTGNFDLTFDASEPFDNIEFNAPIEYARYGRLPLLLTSFTPLNYSLGDNQQSAMLRGVTLTPLASAVPGATSAKPQ
jgi:hypothetical protein